MGKTGKHPSPLGCGSEDPGPEHLPAASLGRLARKGREREEKKKRGRGAARVGPPPGKEVGGHEGAPHVRSPPARRRRTTSCGPSQSWILHCLCVVVVVLVVMSGMCGGTGGGDGEAGKRRAARRCHRVSSKSELSEAEPVPISQRPPSSDLGPVPTTPRSTPGPPHAPDPHKQRRREVCASARGADEPGDAPQAPRRRPGARASPPRTPSGPRPRRGQPRAPALPSLAVY